VLSGTHEISDRVDMATYDEHTGMGETSRSFLWQDIGTFRATQEIFCGICGPQIDASDIGVVKCLKVFLTQFLCNI
jgi:hypothetical protein